MSDDEIREIRPEGDTEEYEKICYVCRRPESKAGRMIQIQGDFCICNDCMQKTFDQMSHMGFNLGDMMNPGAMINNTNRPQNQDPGAKETGADGVEKKPEEGAESDTPEEGTGGDTRQNIPHMGFPNISMINLADLQGMMGMAQPRRVKKKKEKKDEKPVIELKDIPAPHVIKARLDEYVIGQEYAKKIMSVAVYNHYKRVATEHMDDIEIGKSNMLMIGPTGCGKTYLVQTLARLLNVPLAITDATSLTEAGYIGDDIESVVSKLLAAADNDVEKAETGIIFIDEIDKIAKKRNTNQRDVSGESVQQGMLKLLEGAEVEVPVGASSKNAMVPMVTVNTKNILFICGGAFPDMEDIIKERLNKNASVGFQADLKDKYDKEENLLQQVTTEDVRQYGMIPEFIGRLPILFSLEALTEDMLVQILTEPKNALLKQYEKLLALDEVKLIFTEGAVRAIAKKAKERKVGARALRAIIEEFMLDIMYEIPKDDEIGVVTITEEYIEKKGGPVITMRGTTGIVAHG